MSEFHVVVTRVGEVEKHPNADSLSVTKVLGEYPVVFRTGGFFPGELAVYVPVDSLVPVADPRFAFLDAGKCRERERVRAKRLRGVFSMGLLVPADPDWHEGQDVRELLSVEKWEPPEEPTRFETRGPREPGPELPCGTPDYDLEAFRRNPDVLVEGEQVVITEKLHGTNARFVYHEGRLWVGSHHAWKAPPAADDALEQPEHWVRRGDVSVDVAPRRAVCAWWQVARDLGLEAKLSAWPGWLVYGEIYGWVQDLKYGAERPGDLRLAVFDVRAPNGMYLGPMATRALCVELDLPAVPLLYSGPWSRECLKLAEGPTTLGGDHVREGIVVEADPPRWDMTIGRVKLKHVGEGYSLR